MPVLALFDRERTCSYHEHDLYECTYMNTSGNRYMNCLKNDLIKHAKRVNDMYIHDNTTTNDTHHNDWSRVCDAVHGYSSR